VLLPQIKCRQRSVAEQAAAAPRAPWGTCMNGPEPIDDVARLSFEDALGELEAIVRRLEEGSGKLEEAVVAYERGVALQRHCDAKLQEAQMRVERIVLGRNGAVAAEPISFE